MNATPEYLALQKQLHESNPDYGTSGMHHAEFIAQLCAANGFKTLLDYGSGKGTLNPLLPGIDVTEFDIAIPGKDDRALLVPHDIVVCTDVLEHIEPEFLQDVFNDLRACTRSVLFVAVHCGPAVKVLADGRNAHLIQRPPRWWLSEFFANSFELVHFRRADNPTGFMATWVKRAL